jgi:hypothetical protein
LEKSQAHTPQLEKEGLQQQIVMEEEELKKGQVHITDFTGVIEYSFKLWTHLQNAP